MTKSETYYLIGRCLVMDEFPELRNEFIQLVKLEKIDWLKFIEVGSNNLVLQLLYCKFRTCKIIKYLPQEVSEFLSELYELNRTRNIEILKHIEFINRTLEPKGINLIYLKGTANLIDGLYADVGERLMGDIDFLVEEKDYFATAAAMLDVGYYNPLDNTSLNVKNSQHYPNLYHPDFTANIEIHQFPVEYDCDRWFNSKINFEDCRRPVNIENCYVQSDKHKAIHNFIHGQLDHFGYMSGKVLLRDAYDFYLFSKRVDLADVFSEIELKRKAAVYASFVKRIIPHMNYKLENNLPLWLFKWKHDFRLNSKTFNSLILKMMDLYVDGKWRKPRNWFN